MTSLSIPRTFGLSRSTITPALIVFFGGANLILIQWVLVRELTTLLLGTELVTLLVTISYFLGLSLGYGLARRICRAWLIPLAVITLILHLSLPIWFRLVVTGLDSMGLYALTFLVLPALVPLIISSFYSVFLPLLVDSGEGQLPVLYGVELLGSICGVMILFLLGGLGLQTVFVFYAMGLLLILAALKIQPLPLVALAIMSVVWLLILPSANKWSNAIWYMQIHNLPSGTTTLFSSYSAYQKVDVLQGIGGERYLFLDGLEHFGGVDGSQLNVILGRIPAQLLQPENALVIGAGSMEMAAMIADSAGQVTTVEIDPLVVNSSLRYFDSVNQMSSLDNRRIVIDDAKHYIANTSDRYDLVSTDTPAAYAIQTATLYSASFYQAIAAHLNPGGVLAANLTSSFAPDDEVSRRIAASLLTAFDEVIVVTSQAAGWSFAYASDDLPFDRAAIENALRASGETGFVIFDTPAVRAVVGDARPITLDSMDIVLHISLDWIQDRWN